MLDAQSNACPQHWLKGREHLMRISFIVVKIVAAVVFGSWTRPIVSSWTTNNHRPNELTATAVRDGTRQLLRQPNSKWQGASYFTKECTKQRLSHHSNELIYDIWWYVLTSTKPCCQGNKLHEAIEAGRDYLQTTNYLHDVLVVATLDGEGTWCYEVASSAFPYGVFGRP